MGMHFTACQIDVCYQHENMQWLASHLRDGFVESRWLGGGKPQVDFTFASANAPTFFSFVARSEEQQQDDELQPPFYCQIVVPKEKMLKKVTM